MTLQLRRHDVMLQPDISRVIIRPFIPSNSHQVSNMIGRILSLSEEEAGRELDIILADFASRHGNLEARLMDHFRVIQPKIFTQRPLSRTRQLLIGALFSGEYALESAALFNPSIVPHPDQTGVAEGCLRFIMSLRATGEGHISSIEFRSGLIAKDGAITLDPVSRHVSLAEVEPNPTYRKKLFIIKLSEMGFDCNATEPGYAGEVMKPLAENFTLRELDNRVRNVRHLHRPEPRDLKHTLECIHWLAVSNYELHFDPALSLSERAIFPVSPNESNGIEDARFVRFTEQAGGESATGQPAGGVMYYATYTAYNGRVILPQLIETQDFLHFRILTLNGNAVQNKGMALFPRRIDDRYAMLSRQDDENLFIMFSDNPHYWNDPQLLLRPAEIWESVKIGNCGSPIETEAGWIVLTHGVGPMRKYCLGAVLLDLADPAKVIGRLREPLILPEGMGREGYVPNVVYSCGSLKHGRELILPYAMSDRVSVIVSVSIGELLAAMAV
ncbi:MAG: glycoside hydrolase family 130 protein [Candidatus Hydrogenedentota bacterium]